MIEFVPNCDINMLDYGQACFTTINVKDGQASNLELHYERLKNNMELVDLPYNMKKEEFISIINSYILKNSIFSGAIRFTCGDGQYYLRSRPNPYIELSPVRLKLNPILRDGRNLLYYVKSNNFLANYLDLKNAKNEGYDEVLQLNMNGHVCEGACSNIFIVKDDKIKTPKIECGLLNGTIRQKIIMLFNVEEVELTIEDLRMCDEAFMTNSLRIISPIVQFEKINMPIGPMTRKINNILRMEQK